MFSHKANLLASSALLSCAVSIAAQESRFQITAFSVLGGGISSGGQFTVSGGIASSAPGLPDTGAFSVEGGIWNPPSDPVEPDLPELSAVLSNGSIIVSWPKSQTTWVLEEIPALSDT